jgi:hypothetical protein
MKKLISSLLAIGVLVPITVSAQQVNTYGVCRQYREVYTPGYNDQYGNYVSGRVYTQSYIVPCDGSVATYVQPQQQYYQRQRVCNPAAGALMGAGLGSALSGGSGWNRSGSYNRYYGRNYSSGNWNNSYRNKSGWTMFGAGLGALMYSC